MTEAVTDFLASLALHFTIKHETPERERAWTTSMIVLLRGFSNGTLHEAGNKLVRTRKFKTFPLPADCIEMCEAIEKRAEMERRALAMPTLGPLTPDEWSSERQRVAYDVCHTAIGRQAAREGWVRRLWHFARIEQRHPQALETDRLKREAKAHKQLVAQCHAGGGGYFSYSLARFGDSMLAKEDRLAGEVLGQ